MFSGKNVIVTGAASGIGQAQAAAFLKHGATVYAVDLQNNLELAAHPNCYFFQQDVTQIDQIKKLQQLPQIDILCNTCGMLDDYLPLDQMEMSLWQQIINNNLTTFAVATKFALTKMLPFKQGIIINMASIAGVISGGGGFAYTASKHAIVGMTKQLTYDYAHLGIRVNAIAPGAIRTPMTESDFQNGGQIAKEVAERIPAKRYATSEEVAQLTLFVASSAADYLYGDIIPIDGGWLQRN